MSETNTISEPRIGIVTALPKEYAAMQDLIVAPTDIVIPGRGAGRRYCSGEIPGLKGGKHSVVLCRAGMGNNNATLRAALLLEHFKTVDSVVMVGIAGGVPNPNKASDHVRLGDIVVSDEGGVVQYDLGKEVATTVGDQTTIAFVHKNPPRPPSAVLLESVGILEAAEIRGERPWVNYIARTLERLNRARPAPTSDILVSSTDPALIIDHPYDPTRREGEPRLFTGTIGAANIVLKNPQKRDYLRDKFGVKAIEMEGSGIADASWNVGIGYLVVRGICDYCDSNKGDDWQMYAAIVAASYVRSLIESMPTPEEKTPSAPDKPTGVISTLSPDEYVRSVKAFAETNPYLSLHQLLAGGEPQPDSYVPLILQPYEPTNNNEYVPLSLSDVLNHAYDSRYVMFLGPGGAGKSTLLRQIARLAWDAPATIGLEQRYLPMLIRLSAFAAAEGIVAETKLRDAMNKAREIFLLYDLPEGFFSDWPLQTNAPWILLFDGLDEVPQDQRATVVTQILSLVDTIKLTGYKLVIASRPDEFVKPLESTFKRHRVLGFGSRQQKEFASHWFGSDAEAFLKEINDLHAPEISSSPLLLTIAAVVFRKDRQLVKNKASLYGRFVQIWLDEAETRGLKRELGTELFEVTPSVLEYLALKMTEQPGEGSFISLSRAVAAYFTSVRGVTYQNALAQAKRVVEMLGLRSGVFIKNGDVCSWVHGNIREYLAARAIETKLVLSAGDFVTVLGDRPFDPDWRDVVINLVQLVERPKDLLEWLVAQAAEKDNADASLLAYEYSKHTNLTDDADFCNSIVRLLVKGLGDWQGRPFVLQMLKAALIELGQTGIHELVATLNKLNGLQSEILPEWNGNKPPDIHIEPGNSLYKGYKQRRGIIEVLGEVKGSRAVEHLLPLLYDDERDCYRREIRYRVRKALTCIGLESVLPLLSVIRDSAHSMKQRHEALVALKLVGLRTESVSATLDECF